MLNAKGKKFFFFDKEITNIIINPCSVEHAYLSILNNDLQSAKEVFAKCNSARSIWGEILVEILSGYLKNFPTFFQIRNFLEVDLDFLLKNEKIDYIQQILGAEPILSEINMETCKFIARVMFANKLYSSALKYMEKSKKIHYNDAELHFMLSKYYLQVHDNNSAYFYIHECLRLMPDYYPAIILKQQIEEISD